MGDTVKDWEARARELLPTENKSGYSPHRVLALQIGHEMALEERKKWMAAEHDLSDAYLRLRAMIPGALDTHPEDKVWEHTEACLRKLAGSADERAEEIARYAEGHINAQPYASDDTRRECASLARSIAAYARSTIRSAPKTRERVLEEALRYYANRHVSASNPWAGEISPGEVARRALEWKP